MSLKRPSQTSRSRGLPLDLATLAFTLASSMPLGRAMHHINTNTNEAIYATIHNTCKKNNIATGRPAMAAVEASWWQRQRRTSERTDQSQDWLSNHDPATATTVLWVIHVEHRDVV